MTEGVRFTGKICAEVAVEAQTITVEQTIGEASDQAAYKHTVELYFGDDEVASESNSTVRAEAEAIPLPRGLTQEMTYYLVDRISERATARVTATVSETMNQRMEKLLSSLQRAFPNIFSP